MTIVRRRFPHDFTAETSRSGFSFWTTNETCFFFQTKQQSVQWVKKLQRCNELLHVLSHVYARWATGMGFIDCFDSKKHSGVCVDRTKQGWRWKKPQWWQWLSVILVGHENVPSEGEDSLLDIVSPDFVVFVSFDSSTCFWLKQLPD